MLRIIPYRRIRFKAGGYTHETGENGIMQEAPEWITQDEDFPIYQANGSIILIDKNAFIPSGQLLERKIEEPNADQPAFAQMSPGNPVTRRTVTVSAVDGNAETVVLHTDLDGFTKIDQENAPTNEKATPINPPVTNDNQPTAPTPEPTETHPDDLSEAELEALTAPQNQNENEAG